MKHILSVKAVSAIISFLVITSCATKPIPVAYKCPTLVLPADPIPATKTLNAKSTPDQVVKAWVATAYAYRGWNQTVRHQMINSK